MSQAAMSPQTLCRAVCLGFKGTGLRAEQGEGGVYRAPVAYSFEGGKAPRLMFRGGAAHTGCQTASLNYMIKQLSRVDRNKDLKRE